MPILLICNPAIISTFALIAMTFRPIQEVDTVRKYTPFFPLRKFPDRKIVVFSWLIGRNPPGTAYRTSRL